MVLSKAQGTRHKAQAKGNDYNKSKNIVLSCLIIVICNLFVICYLGFGICFLFAQGAKEPITVNGDNVEYSTDNKEVIAQGNVSINYKNSKLSCEKIMVNTETKNAAASGNVRLEDQKGIIEGTSVKYNLQSKTGTINDAEFRSSPYFGKSKELDRVSESEFVVNRGYISSCSYDYPHYRMKAKKINFFPGDKVVMRDIVISTGQHKQFPLMYLPKLHHSFKDPFMHAQLMPGHRKDWGYYMLSGWRHNLTENISARLYLDYRDKLGLAEGFGANYKEQQFGKGDFKYYYTQERSKPFEEGQPAEFQRYFIRWRHKWDIDNRTNFVSEYHRLTDSKRVLLGSDYNFLKDYFPREYEKDTLPLSYSLLHHSFNYSSVDFLVEKRVNRWYDQTEKLPEIKYSLPSSQIYETPFYFENNSFFSSLNKKTHVPSPSTEDINVNKFDTINKLSLPAKVAFIQVTPFVSSRQTFYDKDINGASLWGAPRTIFSTGADASTKFYRIFNVKSDFLGLNINDLRHVITPTVGYFYQHAPTIQSSKLKLEDVLNVSNAAALGLYNKLQTKRDNQAIDIADFRVDTIYNLRTGDGNKRPGNLSDFLFALRLLPYSWLTIDSDAIYKHSGSRFDSGYRRFSNVNYDVSFNFANERSVGVGQRYQRKGSNEITNSLNWRVSPKWRFAMYQRRNIGNDMIVRRGLREQEYTFSRDLHCWEMDFTYNVKRNEGESVWLIFRLKAFPENEFGYNQTYHVPKPGSQADY